MSRIGSWNIPIPDKVTVEIQDDGQVNVEGPKGKLTWSLPREISATVEDNAVAFTRTGDNRKIKALHGLSRSLVNNMVKGVSEGYEIKLEIHGVGFRAAVQGKILNLNLGYSHPVKFAIPDGITIEVQDNTKLTITGIDKQVVGQVAADIRAWYPPEPYKGKGVRYVDEQIIRKTGKSV
jgi:large subunit ribosomal protein L6